MTDPIQHLRELMAKATPLPLRDLPHPVYGGALHAVRADDGHDWFAFNYVAMMRAEDAGAYLALRNLAPQLLDVVEAARSVAEWHDEVHAGNGVRYARLVITLREKLAALGGKGGGG